MESSTQLYHPLRIRSEFENVIQFYSESADCQPVHAESGVHRLLIEDPTITSLPGMPSTGSEHVLCNRTNAPIGLDVPMLHRCAADAVRLLKFSPSNKESSCKSLSSTSNAVSMHREHVEIRTTGYGKTPGSSSLI